MAKETDWNSALTSSGVNENLRVKESWPLFHLYWMALRLLHFPVWEKQTPQFAYSV